MKDKISVKPKIVELQNANDIYMTMNICILSNDVNYNNAQFTNDFIDGVIENKDKYIGIPFLASREKLKNGDFDNLTHELNTDTGQLETDQIGSFVDFWKEEIDGADCLMGQIRIFKRFPEVCSAIKTLFSEGLLETSCEVLVSEYQEISEEGIRLIHYNNGKNALIGSACVTHGAEKRAKGTLLIAEAYQRDIQKQKGDIAMPQNSSDKVELSNKGVKVKYHGQLEVSSLHFHEIENKIYNLLNPVDTENGGRDYNYYIIDLFNDKVVVGHWDKDELYEIKYSIESENVVLAPEEDWVKGSYGFIPDGVDLSKTVSQYEERISELQEELDDVKKDKEAELKELETKMVGLQEKFDKATEDLKQANDLIVSEQEKIQELEQKIQELNQTIDELKVYKEKYEEAEREKQQKELSEKYGKLFDEKTFKSKEIQRAIETCDVATLNSKFVEIMSEQRQKELEMSQKSDGDIEIAAAKGEDLVPQEKDSSYWASPVK